jgi:hypothetical protein
LFPCNVGPACKTAGVCWKVQMIREKNDLSLVSSVYPLMSCTYGQISSLLHMWSVLMVWCVLCDNFQALEIHVTLQMLWRIPSAITHNSFINVHHTNFTLQHSQQVYMLWCTSASSRSEIRRILMQQEFLVSGGVHFYSSLTSKTFPPRASSCHYKHNRY